MQLDEQLFQKLLPDIQHQTWYRQRFDACPHFMFFLGDAHTSSIQHTPYPFGQRLAYAGFSKNRADWYHSLPALQKTAASIIQASEQNPHISRDMVRDFYPWQEQFYTQCRTINGMNLTALTDTELLETYNALADTYTKKLNASPLIDGFALSTDEDISSKIRVHLDQQGMGRDFVEFFEVLTAPTFLSFLQEEEIALLRVADEIRQHPSDAADCIYAHQQAYFWIQNNYVKDHVLNANAFEERVRQWNQIDLIAKANELKALPLHHAQRKQELLTRIALPEELTTLLNITDDFNAWQDERKKGTFWATHVFSTLLQEFSRRTGYTMDELKYCFPPEMASALDKKISKEELQARFEYCMILWTADSYSVTTDQEFIATLDKIGTGAYVHTNELKGFSAQLGTARGKVKIIESAEEIAKIEEGDILVAVMTRPDYLPAMKKAAAFVTDEGGITCHAAIVAREMKKPCIVGTKIATKIFKDGDLLEVDADNGLVRLIPS